MALEALTIVKNIRAEDTIQEMTVMFPATLHQIFCKLEHGDQLNARRLGTAKPSNMSSALKER